MNWAAILFVALLGVGNFALHKAVLESGHALLQQMPSFTRVLGGRMSMVMEFVILLAAMLLVGHGWLGLLWAYLAYTAFNGLSAWLILTDRI